MLRRSRMNHSRVLSLLLLRCQSRMLLWVLLLGLVQLLLLLLL